MCGICGIEAAAENQVRDNARPRALSAHKIFEIAAAAPIVYIQGRSSMASILFRPLTVHHQATDVVTGEGVVSIDTREPEHRWAFL